MRPFHSNDYSDSEYNDSLVQNSMIDELSMNFAQIERKEEKRQVTGETEQRPKLPDSLSYLWDYYSEEEQEKSSTDWSTMDINDVYDRLQLDSFNIDEAIPRSEGLCASEQESVMDEGKTGFDNNIQNLLNNNDIDDSPYKKTNVENSTAGYCNCQKSKCLKLYCECFASQRYCINCKCIGCHNVPKYIKEKEIAIARVSTKNPLGFARRLPGNSHKPLVGCNCNKSGCQRNYCSCYKRGIKCTDVCKCLQCKNCKS